MMTMSHADFRSPAPARRLARHAWLFAPLLGLAGCTPPRVQEAAAPVQASSADGAHGHTAAAEHGHVHGAGPHGGTLADWGGGKYHVEFTVDHEAREAVVYVLGSDETTPVPIATTDGRLLLTIREPAFQVSLVARPLPGEAEGTASRYGGTHESLGIVREFAGTISAVVDGTPFAGDFVETPHDHE